MLTHKTFLIELHRLTTYVKIKDCLNIIYVPNKKFWESAMEVFNPRNSMMISRNDGTFNNDMNIFKDMIINSNGLINIGRDYYSIGQKQKIQQLKEKYHID